MDVPQAASGMSSSAARGSEPALGKPVPTSSHLKNAGYVPFVKDANGTTEEPHYNIGLAYLSCLGSK